VDKIGTVYYNIVDGMGETQKVVRYARYLILSYNIK